MFRFSGSALIALAFSSSMALARDVYECKFPIVANNLGYLSDLVILSRETGADAVTLVDAIIQSEKGGPIDLNIAEENEAKLSVSWQILLKSRRNNYLNVAYRISIQKGSLSASLSGRPQGYSNAFSAQGKCRRLSG